MNIDRAETHLNACTVNVSYTLYTHTRSVGLLVINYSFLLVVDIADWIYLSVIINH